MPLVGFRSRRIVEDGNVRAGVVLVRGETIEGVVSEAPPGADVLDVGDLVISPGLVDCHVHINEPGRTEWEGFETATRAAAAGGVTTLVDMPLNSIPVTTNAPALKAKVAAAEGKCFVDVGFWGGVVPGNARDLRGLADQGVLGCKAFLIHSGIDEFPNATAGDLLEAMPVLRDCGIPLLAHAELDVGREAAHSAVGAQSTVTERVTERDPRAYRGYLQSRPAASEDAAIELLIGLCRQTGCAVHIVHLSSASAIPALRAARSEGLPVTVETCPHYLCLEAESIPDGATHFKCAPPIREHRNREALWEALFEGVIDFVVTDHSPCTPALKLPREGDFHRAWGGIASLQLGLAAIWSEARRRGAGLAQIARWMSAGPADLAGQGGKKGRIAPGLDADLVIWNPEERFAVTPGALFFRHPISPYVGESLVGRVHTTVVRGTVVYDGEGHPAGAIGRPLLHRSVRQ